MLKIYFYVGLWTDFLQKDFSQLVLGQKKFRFQSIPKFQYMLHLDFWSQSVGKFHSTFYFSVGMSRIYRERSVKSWANHPPDYNSTLIDLEKCIDRKKCIKIFGRGCVRTFKIWLKSVTYYQLFSYVYQLKYTAHWSEIE